MTDDNTIGIGDVCTYSYDNNNKSLSIVEVVEEFSDEVLVVKFLQVIVDDSGNGLFTYLQKTSRTMNVSKKYLHKILLISSQKTEIERLSDRDHKCIYLSDDETTEYCVDTICPKFLTESEIRAEAIKKFAEVLKENTVTVKLGKQTCKVITVEGIDNLCKRNGV